MANALWLHHHAAAAAVLVSAVCQVSGNNLYLDRTNFEDQTLLQAVFD
jgi:hypothetical protein